MCDRNLVNEVGLREDSFNRGFDALKLCQLQFNFKRKH